MVPDEPEFLQLCHHDITSKYLSGYQSLASELKISIVPGTICTLHPETSHLHNTAHFISPEGKIVSSYNKKNLWHPERPHLTSSTNDAHTTFDTPLGKSVCLFAGMPHFRKHFGSLSLKARKSSSSQPSGLSAIVLLPVSRAFENTCGIIFCNAGAPVGKGKEDSGFLGISQVTVPFQGALGKMGREEGMNVVELDMQILEDAEEAYKVRMDIGGTNGIMHIR
ncbi:carbon-nitrogen family [Botrytis cinerea]